MANIKQISLAGTTYNLVDDTAVHSVSATSALTTGITTGTITVDGVTTTFYAPDVSGDYYILEQSDSGESYLVVDIYRYGNPSWNQKSYLTPSEYQILASDVQNDTPIYYKPLDSECLLLVDKYQDDEELGYIKFTAVRHTIDWEETYELYFNEDLGTNLQLVTYNNKDKLYTYGHATQYAAITTSINYPVLLGSSAVTTAITAPLNKTDSLKYNPSTKLLQTGALGVISGVGYTTVLPTTTNGYENGQIMFVVFDET